MYNFIVLGIPGPENTCWQGGTFKLMVYFTDDYPIKPPKCQFEPTLFHPNIYSSGTVSLSILEETGLHCWQPSITIPQLLQCIQKLLAEPDNDNYVQNGPHALLKDNPDKYRKTIRKVVRKQLRFD